MKTAIVYYSMSGNTAYVAERLAGRLFADLIRLEPEKAYPNTGVKKFLWGGKSALMSETPKLEPYSFCAQAYDQIILGTPVWASNIAPPLRTFLQEQGEALCDKRIAAYVCSLGGGDKRALEKLQAALNPISLFETLSLLAPKDKASAHTDAQIDAFAKSLLE